MVTDLCAKFFRIICPCFYKAIFTRKGEHRGLKFVFSFLYGVLLGVGFYELIIIDLDFTEYSALLIGGALCLLLGLGTAVSSQIRCIALLSLPSFGGKVGRGVLKAIVLAFVVAGPIANIANNGREVARVFACTTSLTFNLTKTRFELMFKPFQQALLGIKNEVTDFKDTVNSIKDVAAPIAGEMEDEAEMKKMKEENDYLDELQQETKRSEEIEKKYDTKGEKLEAERYKKNYLKKVEMRCEDQLTKAGNKCRAAFGSIYDKCYDTVTWLAAWILCWPMKLTFVCNIVESMGGSKTCDPSKEVDPGFGEGYEYLKRSRTELTQNFKDVKLQYKIGKVKQLQDIRDATDTAKTILHSVKKKKTLLDKFFQLLKRTLALIFLKIIIDSQNYHDKYLRDIEFDNIYLTKYFRKIDARRKHQEKHTLLPLKKVEKLKIIEPLALKPLKREREEIFGQTVKLLLEIIMVSIFVLIDRLFYEILDIIRRHARIDYVQTGHHDMMLDVRGAGMIASLLRNVVRGFNIKKRIKVVRTNAPCLSQPTLLANYYLYKIYGTYFVVWLLIISQAYVCRLRRAICAFYYRKREKRRVLFLYNETLKRRVGFFRYMKKKVKKLVRQQRLEEDLNFFTVLRIRFPNACDWLRIIPMSRRKCLICDEPEPFHKAKIPGSFTKCPTPTCYVVYCLECWKDLGETCYACTVDSPAATEFEDSDESDIVEK